MEPSYRHIASIELASKVVDTPARLYDVPLPALPEEHVTVFRRQDRRRAEGVRIHLTKVAFVSTRDGLTRAGPAVQCWTGSNACGCRLAVVHMSNV